ncbi:neuromedin-S isoform 1-T1 [Liasis olivaceus]
MVWNNSSLKIAGVPQTFASFLDESKVPKSERLALCFSQWTELFDQPQISSLFLDLCNSMFNSLQIDEENNQELNKRFLFHYSRAQDPTYPLKTGSFPLHPLMSLAPKLSERRMKRFLNPELQIIAAKFTKKEGLDGLGRPFFLFRVLIFLFPFKKKLHFDLQSICYKIKMETIFVSYNKAIINSHTNKFLFPKIK